MTHAEYLLWVKYLKKYGTTNPVRRYDRTGAIIAHQINQAFKGKAKITDFLPWGKDKEEIDELKDATEFSMEDYIKSALGGKVKIGKRKCR